MADADAVKEGKKSLDLILDTISDDHLVSQYGDLLDVDGTHVLLGLTKNIGHVEATSLLFGRTGISGSLIGGIKNTQLLMDLCCKDNIRPEIEVIEPQLINRVFEKLHKSNDSGLRYVIDCSKLTDELISKYESAPPDFS